MVALVALLQQRQSALAKEEEENVRISTSLVNDGVGVLEVEGAIDAHTARELDRALHELLDQGHPRLLLDASQVIFISSAGLRVVVYAYRRASQVGGQLRVCGLNAHVRRVFEMAALDDFLQLGDTRQEALEGW
jgi:anti-sigma B factor antagonist